MPQFQQHILDGSLDLHGIKSHKHEEVKILEDDEHIRSQLPGTALSKRTLDTPDKHPKKKKKKNKQKFKQQKFDQKEIESQFIENQKDYDINSMAYPIGVPNDLMDHYEDQ